MAITALLLTDSGGQCPASLRLLAVPREKETKRLFAAPVQTDDVRVSAFWGALTDCYPECLWKKLHAPPRVMAAAMRVMCLSYHVMTVTMMALMMTMTTAFGCLQQTLYAQDADLQASRVLRREEVEVHLPAAQLEGDDAVLFLQRHTK